MPRFITRSIHSSVLRLLGSVFSFLVVVLTSRLLGINDRGQIVAISTFVTLAATICSLSLGQALVRPEIEKVFGGLQKVSAALLALSSTWTFIFGMLIWASFQFEPVMLLLEKYLPNNELKLISIPLFFVLMLEQFVIYLAAVAKKHLRSSFWYFSSRFFWILTLIILYKFGKLTIESFFYSQILSVSIGVLFSWRVAPDFSVLNFGNSAGFKIWMRDAGFLHMATIGALLSSGYDQILLLRHTDTATLAIYNLCGQIITIFVMPIQLASGSLIEGSRLIGARALLSRIRTQVMPFIGLYGIGLISLTHIFGDSILEILGGSDFKSGARLLPWMSMTIFGQTISIFMAHQWIYRGHLRATAFLSLGSGCFNVILLNNLIPLYGIWGAVYSVCINYALIFLINFMALVFWTKSERYSK